MKYLLVIIIILFLYILIYNIIKIYKMLKMIDIFYYNINQYITDNKYITYSNYKTIKNKYFDIYEKSRTKILFPPIVKFNKYYQNLYKNLQLINEDYIKRELVANKDFFDSIFNYPLDIDQRKAIIIDDDYNLIIAGAGTGKTSTMIGKIKYLVAKKKISPESIMAISFSRNTVDNLKDKLESIGIYNVECLTFHKLGKQHILNYHNLIAENLLEEIISKYINEMIINDREKLYALVDLFGLYMHIPNQQEYENLGEMYDYENGYDLETMKAKYNRYKHRDKDLYTLKQEKVKSIEELVIANYLFLNGINYEYEKKYPYAERYHPDFYLTDYKIYLEHFGINEFGRCPQYESNEETKYINEMKWKRILHQQNNTTLLETYSYYFKKGIIIPKLEKLLKNAGVIFNKVDYKKVHEAIIKNQQREEFSSFIELLSKFISMFKGNNHKLEKLEEFYQNAKRNNNIREQHLLSIIKEIYIIYENALIQKNQLDFNDLINKATEHVKEYGFNKKINYIIVDEFQDTSLSRFSLINTIKEKTNAKLIVVGDDWQSIYRFSGCDLSLFVNFDKYVNHHQKIFISETHRNSQQLVNIAGNFIMKNKKGQITKHLKSTINDNQPIHLYYYYKDIKNALDMAINDLKQLGCKNIGVLGRNKSDIKWFDFGKNVNLKSKQYIDLSSYYKDINIKFCTVHKSKGLEFDGTIIVNMKNFIAGFPNKMSDDPILSYVTATQNDYLYEEERRLFYVALTRTKTKTCILVPNRQPSTFVEEIVDDNGDNMLVTICEPDYNLTNHRCPICKKGKLVVRKNNVYGNEFLGCINYPKCTYTIDMDKFKKQMNK